MEAGESFVGEDLNGEGGPTDEVFDVNDAGSSRGQGEGVGEGRVIEGRGSGARLFKDGAIEGAGV